MMITVPPGASLWSLAQRYYHNGQLWPLIYQANPQLAPDPDLVLTGQQIEIPDQPRLDHGKAALAALGLAGTEGLLVLAIATVLAGAIDVHMAMDRLTRQFAMAGIPQPAARAAIAVVLALPPDRLGAHGPATRTVMMLNLVRRAQFVYSASKRIAAAITEAHSRGEDVLEAFYKAAEAERRYYGQHLLATWNRADAAAKTDSAAMEYGLLLGWNTVIDKHTSAECRHADGRNFWADAMPLIGYPGMVHPHCRCWPGKPVPGAPILPSASRRQISGNPAPGGPAYGPVPAIA